MQIAIVGGGRWARTIAAVLCSLPSRTDRIAVYTTHHVSKVIDWGEQLQLGERLRVVGEWPDITGMQKRPDAVIIANRAADHFAAARAALQVRIPTLVEKPMAWPKATIASLIATAEAHATILAGSNVFLFARYFAAFAELIATLPRRDRLHFTWIDGPADVRRGEVKSYDPALTLFDDVLPHVVPMLGSLEFSGLSVSDLEIRRGGADLTIEARAGQRSATIRLARDGDGRHRLITVDTAGGPATLDFADEPGLIRAPGIVRNGDPQWDSAARPLATMLIAFLAAVEGQPLDARLSPTLALAAGGLADQVRSRYVAHQRKWLEQRLGTRLDSGILYALKELAGDHGGMPSETAAAWSQLDSASRLNAFLAQSRLVSEAGA